VLLDRREVFQAAKVDQVFGGCALLVHLHDEISASGEKPRAFAKRVREGHCLGDGSGMMHR
jgi:hypothetical protein